jgi:hypothetical protein
MELKEVPSCSVAVGRGAFFLLGDELVRAEETLTFFLFGTVTAFGTNIIVGAAMDSFCIFFIGTGFFFAGAFGFVGASSNRNPVGNLRILSFCQLNKMRHSESRIPMIFLDYFLGSYLTYFTPTQSFHTISLILHYTVYLIRFNILIIRIEI